jgi:hypothetical protein
MTDAKFPQYQRYPIVLLWQEFQKGCQVSFQLGQQHSSESKRGVTRFSSVLGQFNATKECFAVIAFEFLNNLGQRVRHTLAHDFDFKSSDSINRNGNGILGKLSLMAQAFAKGYHDAFLNHRNEIDKYSY